MCKEFAAVIILLIMAGVYANPQVYYGDYDDRMQYYQLEKSTKSRVKVYGANGPGHAFLL